MGNHAVLAFLLAVEFLVYVDRGIIPGCTNEINLFIRDNLNPTHPSVFLGILQSAFIGGLSISCPIFAHLTHYVSAAYLISCGLLLWILAACAAGFAPLWSSYPLLVTGRVLSGVGEAALISLVPPLILRKAKGAFVGFWMGCFCAVIPVGTAAGFVYGALIASSHLKWGFAFFLEAMLCFPVAVGILVYPQCLDEASTPHEQSVVTNEAEPTTLTADEWPAPIVKTTPRSVSVPPNKLQHQEQCDDLATVETSSVTVAETAMTTPVTAPRRVALCRPTSAPPVQEPQLDPTSFLENDQLHHGDRKPPSFIQDILSVLRSPPFVWLSVAYAAYSAVITGFSTFGSAYLQNLGFVDKETTASILMGGTTALAGVLGSLAGGSLAAVSTKEPPPSTDTNEEDTTVARNPDARSYSPPSASAVRQVKSLMTHMIPVILISTAVLGFGTFSWSLYLFLGLFALGLGGLFMTQSGINISAMLVVPPAQQSCAIALITVLLHAFGDVPSPIFVGLLKDALAPACSVPETGDAEVLTTTTPSGRVKCADQLTGVRLSILITILWLTWMLLGVVMARQTVSRRRHNNEIRHVEVVIPTPTSPSPSASRQL